MATASYDDELERLLIDGAQAFADLIEAIVAGPRPVVAALRGAAVGGGLALALAADVRIAGRSTRLTPGWGRWGLPPDGGASALIGLPLGPSAAATWLVTGDTVDVGSPWATLLFHRIVDDADVLDTAVAVAEQVAATPGAVAAKAVTRPLVVPLLQAQQQAELEALAAAVRLPAVRAAMLEAGGGA
jgi:2-(1,2-epoxy-1,2-dihydrophenyl)acetyl-CoA isomerase